MPRDKEIPAAGNVKPAVRPTWRRVVLALLPVFVLLGLAETGLRMAGVGFPTSFFIPREAGVVETNSRFAWRFMSRELARDPLAFRMARPKPAHTVRIFILGESAAQGFPDAAFGFGEFLEIMLRARHPGTNFEVINTAMTAVNSHAVREIAGECMGYEPDLLLVYCGNNEVVGPFGPGTVFQAGTPPLWLIRLQLQLARLRTGQALRHLADHALSAQGAGKQWRGMEIFLNRRVPADDPRLERVYANFRANLRDVMRAAARRAVPLVICTVPVNLEACAPFASAHRRGLTKPEEAQWSEAYALGTNAEAHAQWAEAEGHYAAAAALDAGFAEVDFRRARCLAALGRSAESRKAFSDARDHDTLRFRADARMNALVRELARGAGPRVRLYDAEADLASGHADLFYEHVHPTFAGHYRLASGFLPRVEAALGLADGAVAAGVAPLTADECAARLAYTPWSRWMSEKIIIGLMQRPPFTLQFDRATTFPERLARYRASLRAASSPGESARSRAAYEQALRERPGGPGLRADFVELLSQSGDHERAIQEARRLLAQRPGDERAKLRVADVMLYAGRFTEALPIYRDVLRVRPELPETYSSMVGALVGLGRDDEALAVYRAAMERGCETSALHSNVAVLSMRRGELAGAEEHLRQALQWTDEPVWHANLGAVLFTRQKFAEALTEFRAAVAAQPNDAAFRYNLGRAHLALGNTREAIEEFQRALQINPDYDKARRELAKAQGQP